MKIAPINVTQYSNTQKRNNNKINNSNQPNFKGLVKLTDFNGQSIVMDAKKILGAIDTPIKFDFRSEPSQYYIKNNHAWGKQYNHAVFQGINISYDNIYPQKLIDSIPFGKQRNFLDSRIVQVLGVSIDDFITFWQKALTAKTNLEFKSNVDNEFLQKVKTLTAENHYYIGKFWDTPLEQEMKNTPGFIRCYEDGSDWWK